MLRFFQCFHITCTCRVVPREAEPLIGSDNRWRWASATARFKRRELAQDLELSSLVFPEQHRPSLKRASKKGAFGCAL